MPVIRLRTGRSSESGAGPAFPIGGGSGARSGGWRTAHTPPRGVWGRARGRCGSRWTHRPATTPRGAQNKSRQRPSTAGSTDFESGAGRWRQAPRRSGVPPGPPGPQPRRGPTGRRRCRGDQAAGQPETSGRQGQWRAWQKGRMKRTSGTERSGTLNIGGKSGRMQHRWE